MPFIFLKLGFLNDSSRQHTKCVKAALTQVSRTHARWQARAGKSVCPDLRRAELQLPPPLPSTARPISLEPGSGQGPAPKEWCSFFEVAVLHLEVMLAIWDEVKL